MVKSEDIDTTSKVVYDTRHRWIALSALALIACVAGWTWVQSVSPESRNRTIVNASESPSEQDWALPAVIHDLPSQARSIGPVIRVDQQLQVGGGFLLIAPGNDERFRAEASSLRFGEAFVPLGGGEAREFGSIDSMQAYAQSEGLTPIVELDVPTSLQAEGWRLFGMEAHCCVWLEDSGSGKAIERLGSAQRSIAIPPMMVVPATSDPAGGTSTNPIDLYPIVLAQVQTRSRNFVVRAPG